MKRLSIVPALHMHWHFSACYTLSKTCRTTIEHPCPESIGLRRQKQLGGSSDQAYLFLHDN